MIRVSDWIMQRLANEGVEHVFLLPGGGAMHLNDALACEPRLIPIPCHHEQACGIAAEAYGRTGANDRPRFGVALVTTGPGATNIITPVTGAWIDSIPMLVISGQVKSTDLRRSSSVRQSGVQEVDILPMISGVTKYSACLSTPQSVQHVFDTALAKMFEGRPGPVWIEVPLDIQAALIESTPCTLPSVVASEPPPLDNSTLNSIIDRIKQSARPLLLLGHGARLSGAANKLLEFVDKYQIPVVSTWNALDLIEHDHPLYVGSPGVVALRAPNFAIQNCDLLISLGCRLDNVVTAYNKANFAPNACKIVVDIDQNELHSHQLSFPSQVICSDVSSFLDSLSASFPSIPVRHDWLSQCQNWKDTYTACDGDIPADSSSISHYQLVSVLSDLIPQNAFISTGSSGLAIEVLYSTFRTKAGQRLFLTSGLGSMGYGLPSAIGTCLGIGNKPVVCIESDGSLMLNIQELATLKALNLPIKILILDNNGYASIANTQRNYFESRFLATGPSSGLHIPDLAAVATSFGLSAHTISDSETLRSDLDSFLAEQGPSLCVVKLVSAETLWPKVSAIPQPDGTIISMPLEDMSPLLPLEELTSQLNYAPSQASLDARSTS